MAEGHAVYTIGHSTHPMESFLALLRQHGVTAVADVRSAPYSSYQPHYNREPLAAALKGEGIAYVFLGRELGARSEDRASYAGGRVQYRRLAASPAFRRGLERVLAGAREHRIALMCAEREPLECHRMLLVARELAALGTTVAHIHSDGRLESQADAEARLLALAGLPESDLLMSRAELVDAAYARQEQRVAYVDEGLARDTKRSLP
ncbi:MAG TPA: DUF488 domain-containing protein [Dongiaceae bacterium]|nr:DUF488 domain-containing protein [Dongiaceae bacterium]